MKSVFLLEREKKGKTIEFDPESSMNEVRKSYVSMSKGWVIDSCLWANVEKREEILDEKSKRGMLMNPSVTWLVPLGLPAYIDPAAGENVSSLSFSPLSYIYI